MKWVHSLNHLKHFLWMTKSVLTTQVVAFQDHMVTYTTKPITSFYDGIFISMSL